MTGINLLQVITFLAVMVFLATLLAEHMALVFAGKNNILSPILKPVETFCYRIFKVDPSEGMDWKSYAFSLLLFNLIGFIALFLLQETQNFLPLNPQKFSAVRWDTAINAAISFVTNTDWQSYTPEATMSYLTDILGMGLQNFLAAATGITVAIVFIRGFAGKSTYQLGNFWVDLTRALLYILLPLAVILSLLLVSQGVIQNFHPYTTAHTLEGHEQIIAQGPAASQIAIKNLGTNGGGFFNANAAHPYENPTPFSDYLEMVSLMIICMAFPLTFGIMLNNRKHGWAIFTAMMVLYLIGLSIVLWSEYHGNPLLAKLGVTHGNSMEGKEMRFNILSSTVFGQNATASAAGANSSAYDSLMPLTGLVMLFNMAVGEVIFGGVGIGLVGMLLYAILAMFLIGLMVGRSPEIYGKKLEPREMVMAIIALLLPAVLQLIFDACAISSKTGLASLGNSGSHGLSEILYAYASCFGNNGSAFSGLNTDNVFFNLTTGAAMILGRFLAIIPALAIAGSLIQKKFIPEKTRFPTTSMLFMSVLVFTVLIIGGLTFFPVLVIGPILEHMLMWQ